MDAPLVAIVGRPNVGKSTLFNRLVGGRPAIVHDTAGLTRDRRYGELDYFGRPLRVVDTGGLDPEAERHAVGAGIHRQARAAVEEADAVIFVVDAVAGPNPLDLEVAALLRRAGKPLVVAANKIDHPVREPLAAAFYALGVGDVFAVSAAHGRGVDELLEHLFAELPQPAADQQPEIEPTPERLRIAFVGKPNAGKSSLVNRLVGAERALVHDQPGTTTDPVDTPFEFGGHQYLLVDTAGIRRKARIDAAMEKISVSMALAQIARADVAVLVIDAAAGATEQDARLAGAIEERGRAVVIALNKADLLAGQKSGRDVARHTRDELHFVPYAPTALVSALRGDGVAQLMETVHKAAEQHRRRIPTAELNRLFAEVCETHPPPVSGGRAVRIHYLTQAAIRPPTFLLWANRPELVPPSYRRFLANQLRARYQFRGTPIRVIVKARRGHKAKARPRRSRRAPRRRRR